MSAEYALAVEAHNKAQAKFRPVRDAYRARTIGDAEFLAAQKEMKITDVAFDVAYAAEQNRYQS